MCMYICRQKCLIVLYQSITDRKGVHLRKEKKEILEWRRCTHTNSPSLTHPHTHTHIHIYTHTNNVSIIYIYTIYVYTSTCIYIYTEIFNYFLPEHLWSQRYTPPQAIQNTRAFQIVHIHTHLHAHITHLHTRAHHLCTPTNINACICAPAHTYYRMAKTHRMP